MRTGTKIVIWSHYKMLPYSIIYLAIILLNLILLVMPEPLIAQNNSNIYSLWFGAASGTNVNFYRGSTQELNSTLIAPTAFHKGYDAGLYLVSHTELNNTGSNWGLILQAGYDSRKGTFEETVAPCDCSVDLSTNLSYVTVEPSLKYAPMQSKFYFYVGPRLAFNVNKSFSYSLFSSSDIINYKNPIVIEGVFSNIRSAVFSFQFGAGFDIPLVSSRKTTQYVLSPFISFQPYFGQSPRSIETWNITTLRGGVALKFSQSSFKVYIRKKHRRK